MPDEGFGSVRANTWTTGLQRAVGVLVGLLLVAAALLVTAPTASAGGDASTLAALANAERTERGLRAYAASGELASVAQSWASKLAKSGTLAHNPNLRTQVSGYRYVGENVGYGASASQIHGALMKSPGHKANILDRDFTQMGVGAARDSKGNLWIAQVFRQPSSSTSSKPKAAPKPKPSAAPKPSPKPSVRESAQNASAPKAAPAKAVTKKAAKPAAPAPPTMAEKLDEANAWAKASAGDPVASTLSFTRAMSSLVS
jgi:hypothetical protein